MYKLLAGLCACLLWVAPVWAETAQDCIDQFEDLKGQFLGVTVNYEPNCVRMANALALEVESEAGDLPAHCDRTVPGSGGWDHWHLEAKSVVGQESFCVVMLRGLVGQDGCGTEEIRMELPANEAARWQNYLREECRN